MDFQSFVDCMNRPCAVMSVDKQDRGVRIVCANQYFKDISPTEAKYYDGMYYSDHMPRNPKFEDFCYRAAILDEAGHVYAEYPTGWLDQIAIPMRSDSEEYGLCLFTFELTEDAEVRRLATISVNVMKFAIRTGLSLASAEDFREGVRKVLEGALSISGAHNSRLFLVNHGRRSFHIYCEAQSELGLQRENKKLSYDFIRNWERCIGDKNALLLTSERDFDALEELAPEWVENMRSFNVQSLVLLPLRRGSEIIGYVDFINFDTRKAAEVTDVAELITVFLAAEIFNHQLMDKLREMSTTDALTGLNNRFAMLRRMEDMGSECFGVVNLDLNGLKRVNDTQGHEAGDRMLVEAAEALKKIFYFPDIYRTGGDEFIVLLPGIAQDKFEWKVERFRAAMQKNEEVSFACGTFWSDGSTDVPTAFRAADDAMYKDKKAYYSQNPELRRQ